MKLSKLLPQKKWLLTIAILPCFLFSKCKKEEVLPEYYLRCKVNGLDYRPNGCTNCTQCDFLGDTTLIIGGNRDYETLGIGIKENIGIHSGSFFLNHFVGKRGDYKNGTLTNDRYFTDSLRTGQLNIDLIDKSNKIISGTFYFKAYNNLRNDSVSISEGKFRLKYNN